MYMSRFLLANAEFSKRDSMSSATHGAFADVPWPFASAAMPGSRKQDISYNETALHQKYHFPLKIFSCTHAEPRR